MNEPAGETPTRFDFATVRAAWWSRVRKEVRGRVAALLWGGAALLVGSAIASWIDRSDLVGPQVAKWLLWTGLGAELVWSIWALLILPWYAAADVSERIVAERDAGLAAAEARTNEARDERDRAVRERDELQRMREESERERARPPTPAERRQAHKESLLPEIRSRLNFFAERIELFGKASRVQPYNTRRKEALEFVRRCLGQRQFDHFHHVLRRAQEERNPLCDRHSGLDLNWRLDVEALHQLADDLEPDHVREHLPVVPAPAVLDE